jgi:hypothetical protein
MTPLRRKRLLLIAGKPCNHKPYYSQYCELMHEGLTAWTLGWAYLTPKGKAYVQTQTSATESTPRPKSSELI